VALEKTGLDEFQAMQRSLYTCIFVGVLGGGFFLACSLFVERDRAKADAVAHGKEGSIVVHSGDWERVNALPYL